MANFCLSRPNFVDGTADITVAFSGGDWQTSLDWLADPYLSRMARSADATTDSTWLDVDLGVTRDVRLVGVPRASLSEAAQWRIRGSATAGDFSTPVLDSGWMDFYPATPVGAILWGEETFWTGRAAARDLYRHNMGGVYVAAGHVSARYWRIEFADPTNADGYIDLARLWIGPVWQPDTNYDVGAAIGYEATAEIVTALGGAEFATPRYPRRVATFAQASVPAGDAETILLEFQRTAMTTEPVYFVADPEDPYARVRKSFMGRFRDLHPVEQGAGDLVSLRWTIAEVL